MLNFYGGYSKAVNPKKAVDEALNNAMQTLTQKITLIILNISSGYNHSQVLQAIAERIPDAHIVGTTSCGVIGNDFVNETMRALVITIVTGDELIISKVDNLNALNSYKLSKDCANNLLKQNKDINIVMAYAPGIISNGEAIVRGFTYVLGDKTPLLGGLGGFNGNDPSKMFVFFNQEILSNSIVAIAFYDQTLSVAQASHHGYLADNYTLEITKKDGSYIVKLDNKPAWNSVMDIYNLPHTTTPLEALSLVALGMQLDRQTSTKYNNTHTLTAPLVVREDGAMLIQTNIAIGNKITLCIRDEDYLMQGVDNLNQRIIEQYKGKKPVAIFQTDCVARGRISNGVTLKEEIIKNHQDGTIADKNIPWLGMYALGEFAKLNGKNHYHNYTASISVLLR